MPDQRSREDDFLAALQAEAQRAQGAGVFDFDQRQSGLRCVLPDCPIPVHPTPAAAVREETFTLAPPRPREGVGLGWRAANRLWRWLRTGWNYLRQVSGDDAYERYVAHLARFHPDVTPMSRGEHFRRRQEEKWNRLSRCC
ncbi:MAG TPA: YbdD/YjiX family protein [Burkholderiales bacterium]|nr:YbdD/YjiX family protein [Burkholderiales bacterium]